VLYSVRQTTVGYIKYVHCMSSCDCDSSDGCYINQSINKINLYYIWRLPSACKIRDCCTIFALLTQTKINHCHRYCTD